MTDSLPAYGFLGAQRQSVKHSSKEFVRTEADGSSVHVNTAESCHADLRRMVLGVHHWISRKHLDCLSMAFSAPGRVSFSELVASA